MGAAALSALNPSAICSDCSKYVLNAMSIHSQCGFCECDFVTEEVEVPDEAADEELV